MRLRVVFRIDRRHARVALNHPLSVAIFALSLSARLLFRSPPVGP